MFRDHVLQVRSHLNGYVGFSLVSPLCLGCFIRHRLPLPPRVEIMTSCSNHLPTLWFCEENRILLCVGQRSKTTVDRTGEELFAKRTIAVPLVISRLSFSSGGSSSSTLQDSSLSGPASDRSDEHVPGNRRDTEPINPKMKRRMAVKKRTTVCQIFQNGWRSSQIILRKKRRRYAHVSGLRFGTDYESGVRIKEARHFSYFSKMKFRRLIAWRIGKEMF